MTTLRERLRALPAFDTTTVPPFDPDAAPTRPEDLFVDWLDAALAAGVRAPHAMTLSTASADGHVSARTLLLKDVGDGGWCFASHRTSPKGRDLAENARAALTFFWRETGRQVRVAGEVAALDARVGADDFAARPDASRAATLVGRQSEPLASFAQHRAAFAAALDRVRAEEVVAESWTAYALRARSVEFWATTPDAGAVRLRYSRGLAGAWSHGLVWP